MLMGDEVVQDDIAVGIYRLDRFFNVGCCHSIGANFLWGDANVHHSYSSSLKQILIFTALLNTPVSDL